MKKNNDQAIVERSGGFWVVDDSQAVAGPFESAEAAQEWEPTTKTITVLVRDSERPWPLLYVVEILPLDSDEENGIDSGFDHEDEIMEQVVAQRSEELEEDPEDVMGRIELLLAFEGDLSPLMDWRA